MTNIICLTLGDFGVNTYLFAYKKGICIVDPGDKADIIEKSVISLQEKSNLSKDCEISIFLTHGSHRLGHDWNDFVAAAAAAAAAAVHRYQKGLEQSGRITQVTVKQYFST